MAESLEEYIDRIKKEHDELTKQHKGTLNFFLEQIRELAGKAQEAQTSKEPEKIQETARAAEKAAAVGNEMSRGKARQYVANNFVMETNSYMTKSYMGRLLFFTYDAKLKQKLPYWDRFPLVFLISTNGNSGLGINLHYLPPIARARLLFNLETLANSEKMDTQTKLVMTYKLLATSAKYKEFKPCIKRYLFSNIRSRVMVIDGKKWNQVVFLPLAEFQKAEEYKVWSDSIASIKKSK